MRLYFRCEEKKKAICWNLAVLSSFSKLDIRESVDPEMGGTYKCSGSWLLLLSCNWVWGYSIIFESCGDWERHLKTTGKQVPLLSSNKIRTQETTGKSTLNSGKVKEQLYWKAFPGTWKGRKVIRCSQHGFNKGKSCLTNLINFYTELTEFLV